MSSNKWRKYKIGDLYDVFSGLSKPREQFGFGNPFVTFKDVFSNYFLPDNIISLVNTTQKEIASCSVKKGDIFLTRTSETLHELGMSSVALRDYPKATFNGFTKRLRLKENVDINIDLLFLGYYLRSSFVRNQIAQHSSLTTRASLNSSAINSLEICLPESNVQIKIGQMLKSLDDKIENNLQTNQTLEEIARTIFKEWFVNFNYPDADENRKHSEFGEIPESWKVGMLRDIYKTTSGGTPSRAKQEYYDNGTIGWIKSKELNNTFILDTEEKITEAALKNSSAKMLAKHSVLIAMYGATVGEIGITANDFTCNQAICAFLPNENYPYTFIYNFLLHSKQNIIAQAVGSAQQNISQQLLLQFKLLIPPSELVKEFHNTIEPLFEKIKDNIEENDTLKELRDRLLPKLMNGEINI